MISLENFNNIRKLGDYKKVKFILEVIKASKEEDINELLLVLDKIINKEIIEAEVISAKKIDNEVLSLINKKLVEYFKKQVIIFNTIDPEVISGFIIKVEDNILDDSLLSKINRLTK